MRHTNLEFVIRGVGEAGTRSQSPSAPSLESITLDVRTYTGDSQNPRNVYAMTVQGDAANDFQSGRQIIKADMTAHALDKARAATEDLIVKGIVSKDTSQIEVICPNQIRIVWQVRGFDEEATQAVYNAEWSLKDTFEDVLFEIQWIRKLGVE